MTLRRLLVLLLLATACDEPMPPLDAGPADGGSALEFRSPPLTTVGACDGVAGFEAHEPAEPALQWSALHGDVRFFGDHQDPFQMDAHLVTALGEAEAAPGEVDGSDAAFGTYASLVPGGCLVGPWPLPDASRSSEREGLRWLAPGQPVDLGGATHVLVDLRAAPEGPTLDRFLEALLADAVPTAVDLRPWVRSFNGMRDEAFAPIFQQSGENLYRSTMQGLSLRYGGEGRAVTLGFVVGDRVAPSAARVVVALRSAGLAAIVGHGIDTRVAEMSARSAGTGGMAFRTMTLNDETLVPLPDRFEADVPLELGTLAAAEEAFLALGALPPASGPATRSDLEPLPPSTRVVATERHEGARQASLIAAHGAAEMFFPYWDAVDTDSDARLRSALVLPREEGEDPGPYQLRSLSHWSNALADSHAFTAYLADPPAPIGVVGSLSLLLDLTADGEPVVRVSEHSEFAPGDVIVSSRGMAASERMATYLDATSSSASSAGRNGLTAFLGVRDERDYVLRDPAGAERTVVIEAATLGTAARPPHTTRPHGPLTDLGREEIFYADLRAEAIAGQLPDVLAGIDAADAVVLDMRGYPGPDSWGVARHLLYEGSPGPTIVEVHRSILGAQDTPVPQPTAPAANGYRGPVVVLVTPGTQSQAEHLVLTLQAAERVTVVGRPSAGANGNITAMALPGQLFQSFTGMVILQPDGSTFHGRGVRVDHPVPIEAAPLADGVDPELARALEVLTL